jgi:cytochrome d ubiquinol oxidase subunit I
VSAIDAAAVGASLLAFIVVYFALFGAGTFYILRLMRKPPETLEPELPTTEPIRAAGIMPSPMMDIPTEGKAV